MSPIQTLLKIAAGVRRFQVPTHSVYCLRISVMSIAVALPSWASNDSCPQTSPRPISNQPTEKITVSIGASPTSGRAPLLVNLVGAANSSSGASITSWKWNYGDGIWCQSDGAYCGLSVAHYFAEVQTYSVSLAVQDSTGLSGSACVSITPSFDSPFKIATTSLNSATAGSPYSSSFDATKGKLPYTWDISSGNLPPGIAIHDSGVLAGTTSETGEFNFIVRAQDSSNPPKTAMQAFTLTVNSSIGDAPAPPAAFFGFTENDTQLDNFPFVSYKMQRYWDSPPLQWPSLNPSMGVFDFTSLDQALADDYAHGVMEVMYTLSRTPPWATSNPNDTNCHYTGTAPGDGNGECDPPRDLNPDGSGKNEIFKAWIKAIASHANTPGYLAIHAHIKFWEIWNEPDTREFWAGSIAQLARLTEDANCIITGRGVIHENGNGTSTPCTEPAIDATAQIVMPSAHAKAPALTYGQNELYCNNISGIPAYQLPCPNPPDAIASAVDIINFHMKPGNETGNDCPAPTLCTPESAMQMYVSNIHGILQPTERAKPLWDGEASYSEYGFTGDYTDPGMAASFMPRFYLIDWSLGISGIAWYTWDELSAEPAEVINAYEQTYKWLENASLDSPCESVGTLWTCGISNSEGQFLILWDSAQSCLADVCTSSNQTVSPQWTRYQDITTSSPAEPILDHTIPVGIKPVVLSSAYETGKRL